MSRFKMSSIILDAVVKDVIGGNYVLQTEEGSYSLPVGLVEMETGKLIPIGTDKYLRLILNDEPHNSDITEENNNESVELADRHGSGAMCQENTDNTQHIEFSHAEEPTTTAHKWTNAETILLIRCVEKHYKDFESSLKKNVWHKIALMLSQAAISNFTPTQCDTKWKGLKKIYKSVKEHNNRTGNDRKDWPFFNAMNAVLDGKPEIEPVATCSSTAGYKRANDEKESTNDTKDTPKKKKIGKADVIERRHKEKLERQDKFLDLFQQMIQKM